MKKYILVFMFIISIFGVSCSQERKIDRNVSAISQPQQTDDGWQTASLNDVGINSNKLQTLVDKVSDSTYQNIHSVLLAKGGKLVFEHYFPGYMFKYEAQVFKLTWDIFMALMRKCSNSFLNTPH